MELTKVVPWGRSLHEYQRMFRLRQDELARFRILGCGDGPASFNAEASALGADVLSIDPLYQFTAADIQRQIDATAPTVIAECQRNAADYIWREFADPAALGRARRAAMATFLADYAQPDRRQRYIAGALPSLPQRANSRDLALVSHLLLLYSQQLDFAFHLAAVGALLRVAREVRIFPLLDLRGQPSAHLQPLLAELRAATVHVQIETVDYEFQRGANQMLRLLRPAGDWQLPGQGAAA